MCGETEKSVYNSLQHPSSGKRRDDEQEDWYLDCQPNNSEYPVKGRGNQSSGSISGEILW